MPKMWRLARRILGREDLAADAVQEALIFVHETEDVPRNLEAWLLKIVTHRSLTARRAYLRRLRNEQAAARARAGELACLDPEREFFRKELANQIARALQALPADQRQAFLLREIHGLDYDRISLVQQVPIGTVRSRLHRARCELRTRLRPGPRRFVERTGTA